MIPPLQKQISKQAQTNVLPVYARPDDIVMSHGEGSYLFSVSGLKYLDFSAGIAVNALGHGDKGFLEVEVLFLIICPNSQAWWYRCSLTKLKN